MRTIPFAESMSVEFKSDRAVLADSELLDEVIGFANTEGGTIYLGVEDDGTITGVSKKHADSIGVCALIANKTVPSLSVRADLLTEESQPVLAIYVPQSKTVISSSSGKIMRRRLKLDGTPEVVPLYSYEITTRLSDLSLLDYSARVLTEASADDFSSAEIARLRSLIQKNPASDKTLLNLDDEELEIALHLVAKSDSAEKNYAPTVTGMLLIGKREKIRALIPTARAEFQVLEGTTVRVNEETDEPILAVVEKFQTYFEAWNPEEEFESNMYRAGFPEFSKSAFREALVNAFCHRDYSQLGAVRILIDNEGLSVSSPGGFIDGISAENLLIAEPHGRNPCLADVLKRIGLAEKTGRGIDRIYEGQIIYGRMWPDYSESTSRYVRVFLQRAKPDYSFYRMIQSATEQNKFPLSIHQLLILSLLKTEGICTKDEIRKKAWLSPARFEAAMEQLRGLHLIRISGTEKKPKYQLSPLPAVTSAYYAIREPPTRMVIAEQSIDTVRQLARHNGGVISKEEIADALGITPSQAYTLIKQYVSDGTMQIAQKGKYAKYWVR